MSGYQIGYLGQVIGRVAAQHDGLNAIYLPAGLSYDFARAIVMEANSIRPGDPPFAILVSDEAAGTEGVTTVSRSEAIRYRQGRRLAVVPATSVDIASFDGSFREAMGPGFPSTEVNGFDRPALARSAVALLAERAGVGAEAFDRTRVEQQLRYVMKAAADLLVEEREGAASWNRDWYEVVDRALWALDDSMGRAVASGSTLSFEGVVSKYVWAVFGLPRPVVDGGELKTKPPKLVQLLEEAWGSEDSIHTLTREAELLGGSGADALLACEAAGWGGLDEEIAFRSSPYTGLQSFVARGSDLLDEFSALTEDAFVGANQGGGAIEVLTADGRLANEVTGIESGWSLLSCAKVGERQLSEPFRLSLTPVVLPNPETVAASGLAVKVAGRAVQLEYLEGPHLHAGRIEFGMRLSVPSKSPLQLRKVVIDLDLEAGDSLDGYVTRQTVAVHLVPAVETAVLVGQWTSAKKTRLGPLKYVGREQLVDDGEESSHEYELKASSGHRVIVMSNSGVPRAQVIKLSKQERDGWWAGDLPPSTPAGISCDGEEWVLEVGSGLVDPPQSLLLAALSDLNVDPKDPGVDLLESLRGRLETFIGSHAEDEQFLEGLGHLVLPTDLSVRLENVEIQAPLLVPQELTGKWSNAVGPRSTSERWRQARDRFLASWLSCIRLLEPDPDAHGVSSVWPSKRSTSPLAAREDLLGRMLDDYAALVSDAESEDPLVRFVSSFPFSASGWPMAVDQTAGTTVLLSPWHPLRLAWLTGVENTLRKSDRARELVGSVEGWTFPLVGPSPKKSQRMIAIPTEAGDLDVFAAWSMMVPVATEDPDPLATPTNLAGRPAPGSSASGLTASAAEAAMRDFMRINGHLSSVTIDLASSSPAQRMEELDKSVLQALRNWTDEGVLGIHVRDSTHRHGDLPRTEVTNLLRGGLGASVSWSRYRPVHGDPVKSNLRLLQDSGVRVAFLHEKGRRNGVLGSVPLRRFEAPVRPSQTTSLREPGIADCPTPFGRALQAVEERNGKAPALSLEIQSTLLTDDHSDWTISGQTFVSASSLARALAGDVNDAKAARMLWEWRPPFLEASKGSPLNRRPYGSIIRVGSQLTDRITDKLLQLDETVVDGADRVLNTLGSQGIGLSSLLTLGGHHAAGALGFYLSLRLLELASPPAGWVQAVMPIDSCRAFLDVLAPDTKSDDTRRQADLLIIRAREGEVCLIPLEIKMYGLDGEPGNGLPGPGPAFSEPLDQLAHTTQLLRKLQSERARLAALGSREEAALWDNALATLLESGLQLSRQAPEQSSDGIAVLQSVVRGDYKLSLGRPVIHFYQHHPDGVDQYLRYQQGDPFADDVNAAYAALVARPRLVLRAVMGDEVPPGCDTLVDAAKGLIAWAQEHSVYPSRSEEPEAPESGDDEEYVSTLAPEVEPVLLEEDPATGSLPGPEDVREQQPETTGGKTAPGVLEGEAPDSLVEPVVEAHEDPMPVARPRRAVEPEPEGLEPPDSDVGVKLHLGHLMDSVGKSPAFFWPSNTRTTQLNVGVVGNLGTGKTQLLKALLYGMRREAKEQQDRPLSALVFDYKEDFQDLPFTETVGAVVWKPHLIPLNVLALHEPYSVPAAYKRASAFASMLERIYSGIGPVQRERLSSVIMELFEERDGLAPTLKEVLDRYREDGVLDSVSSILNGLVLSQIFTEERDQLVTLSEAMEDKILVLDLNTLGADHQLKNALVVLFLDMFYEAMKRSEKPAFRQTPDGETLRQLTSYLLVDEASNIMAYDFPVLESLLKEGREFGVGTILSSQYLSHFKAKKTNFAETLSTWFVHKVPNVTANELSSLGIVGSAQAMADRIKNLGVHESLYKSDLAPAQFIRERPYWEIAQEDDSQKA